MLAEKVCDLGLYRLGEQRTRPVAQDFRELIVDVRWLNQLDNVIFGHGISLLWWRSGGVKHPHDMPPSRFPPSPTFSDSSPAHPVELKDAPRFGDVCEWMGRQQPPMDRLAVLPRRCLAHIDHSQSDRGRQ